MVSSLDGGDRQASIPPPVDLEPDPAVTAARAAEARKRKQGQQSLRREPGVAAPTEPQTGISLPAPA